MASTWQDCGTYWLNTSPQCSSGWEAARKGRFTASRFGYGLGFNLRFSTPKQTALEIAGVSKPTPSEQNQIMMSEGIRLEPEARQHYERQYKVDVKQVGLAVPKWDLRIGASTDGLVGEEGMIEIKCIQRMYKPILSYLQNPGRSESIDHIWPTHYAQMQGNMAILGRKWCDYIVMCKQENSIFMQRIYYNAAYWDQWLYPQIKMFLDVELEPLLKLHQVVRLDPN